MNSTSEADHIVLFLFLFCYMLSRAIVTYALPSELKQGAFGTPSRNMHQFFLMKIEQWLH